MQNPIIIENLRGDDHWIWHFVSKMRLAELSSTTYFFDAETRFETRDCSSYSGKYNCNYPKPLL